MCAYTCSDINVYLYVLNDIVYAYALFASFILLLSCSPTLGQIDTLRREKEKLQNENTLLVTQLNLQTARENRLMENYIRSQKDLEKECRRSAILEREKAKADWELYIFKEYGKV